MGFWNFKNKTVTKAAVNTVYETTTRKGFSVLVNLSRVDYVERVYDDQARLHFGGASVDLVDSYDDVKKIIQDRT